jgi:hypothetical protein
MLDSKSSSSRLALSENQGAPNLLRDNCFQKGYNAEIGLFGQALIKKKGFLLVHGL